MFKIEKGIAIPAKKIGPGTKYPWEQMEIGDSFFVPALNGETKRKALTKVASASRHNQKKGIKFRMACITDDTGAFVGVRCWRVE